LVRPRHQRMRYIHLRRGADLRGLCAVQLALLLGLLVMGAVSHKTSCHPSPQKQIGTPAQLREPTRTPFLYSRPVTRSPRKTTEGAKREEGGENAVIFLVGKPGHGRPAVPLS